MKNTLQWKSIKYTFILLFENDIIYIDKGFKDGEGYEAFLLG
jgi:hypothetical protein